MTTKHSTADHARFMFNRARAFISDIYWPMTIRYALYRFVSQVITALAFGCLAIDLVFWMTGPVDSSLLPPVPVGALEAIVSDSFFNWMTAMMIVKMTMAIVIFVFSYMLTGFRGYQIFRKSEVLIGQNAAAISRLRGAPRMEDR